MTLAERRRALMEKSDGWSKLKVNFTLGKSASATGTIINNKGGALSDSFSMSDGTLFRNMGPATEQNNVNLVAYLVEFKGSTVRRRISLGSNGNVIVPLNQYGDADNYRISFAYPSSSGLTMTQEDLTMYCKVEYKNGGDTA